MRCKFVRFRQHWLWSIADSSSAAPLECLLTTEGREYTGHLNVTETGKPCKNWRGDEYKVSWFIPVINSLCTCSLDDSTGSYHDAPLRGAPGCTKLLHPALLFAFFFTQFPVTSIFLNYSVADVLQLF